MNFHCLMHHDWEGCKCRQCGRTRDERHDWDGCKCRRCGLVRDEGHDVATVHCRVMLPGMLALFAGPIEAMLKAKGNDLLLEDKRD